jgi:hypothetical protein
MLIPWAACDPSRERPRPGCEATRTFTDQCAVAKVHEARARVDFGSRCKLWQAGTLDAELLSPLSFAPICDRLVRHHQGGR